MGVSPLIYAMKFPKQLIQTSDDYNLFVFPHHKSFIQPNICPIAIPQLIEMDWWPGEVQIFFKRNICRFEKGQPFAQCIPVARRECIVKDMEDKEVEKIQEGRQHLEDHGHEYITRNETFDQYPPIDNLYERMTHLHKKDMLPYPLKKRRQDPKPRVKWR